jgi:hypothetical protein
MKTLTNCWSISPWKKPMMIQILGYFAWNSGNRSIGFNENHRSEITHFHDKTIADLSKKETIEVAKS